MRVLRATAPALVAGVFGLLAAGASASVTPGWECVPTTAGQAVVSGGTASTPSCGPGTTAVLAPTYVSAGVGGKPTAVFSAVNVQIVSGSGSTSGTVNGEGNLVVGYAENANNYPQSGSNDLIVGANNGWSRYGEIVGGQFDRALGAFATVFGYHDLASGAQSLAAGDGNTAKGAQTSVTGGQHNTASGPQSSVTGGEYNLASDPFAQVVGGCNNTAGAAPALTPNCGTSGYEAVSGGSDNRAQGLEAAVSAGFLNQANGDATAVSGGDHNTAGGSSSGSFASVTGGGGNFANGDESSIAGGQYNTATDDDSFVGGGCDNLAGTGSSPTGDCINGDSGLQDGHDVVLGGITNTTTAYGSSISGGEFNIASDPFSMIGGGCDNITGSGSKKTSSCDSGGEGIVGGSSLTGTQKDGTYGVISDGVNFPTPGQITIDANAGQCGPVVIGVSGAQVGDVPAIEFGVAPPAGLLIMPTGVTTAGQVNLAVCNESSSAVHYDNEPIRVMTFH
jgi:hypothetical protein